MTCGMSSQARETTVWWLATVPNLEGRLLRVVNVPTLLAADAPMQFPEFTLTRRAAKAPGTRSRH